MFFSKLERISTKRSFSTNKSKMGNELGNPASKLGITSLAMVTPNVEMKEFEKLLMLAQKNATAKNSDELTREELMAILKQMEKFQPPDSELFVQLFTLFDETGHDVVDYKNYLAGASICLIGNNTNTEKLKFGLSLYDVKDTKCATRGDLKRLLLAVNSTAAYLGDPVLSPKDIDEFTLEMYKILPSQGGQGLAHDDVIVYLLKHPFILKFMHGQGWVRFGGPELQV